MAATPLVTAKAPHALDAEAGAVDTGDLLTGIMTT